MTEKNEALLTQLGFRFGINGQHAESAPWFKTFGGDRINNHHLKVAEKKSNTSELLDAYLLACPHWQPNVQGCSFIEKLKSGSQLAALLKTETGRGILKCQP